MNIPKEIRELSNVVYIIKDEKNKVAYVGQTTKRLRARIGQHLSGNQTIDKYLRKCENELIVDVLFHYKRNYQDIEIKLQEKENFYLKEIKKQGYSLLNVSKIKKLNLF